MNGFWQKLYCGKRMEYVEEKRQIDEQKMSLGMKKTGLLNQNEI